jgi:hypothetical protein
MDYPSRLYKQLQTPRAWYAYLRRSSSSGEDRKKKRIHQR